jgi:hypothetical protein
MVASRKGRLNGFPGQRGTPAAPFLTMNDTGNGRRVNFPANRPAGRVCGKPVFFVPGLLHRGGIGLNFRPALRGVVPLVTSRNGCQDPLEVWRL